MATRGIDIVQSTGQIIFSHSLKDTSGNKVTTGTTELRLYRLEDDGTLDVYDWTTNDFVAPGSGTPDDETTMTHQQRRDSNGTDVDTGIWTKVLSTLTNFVVGQVYIVQVTNTGAVPESQERKFQFGGAVDDVAFNLADASETPLSGTVSSATNTTYNDPEDGVIDVTELTLSNLSIALGDIYQLRGRVLIFKKNTPTTTASRGEGATIVANTDTGTDKIYVKILATLPGNGDKFVIQ